MTRSPSKASRNATRIAWWCRRVHARRPKRAFRSKPSAISPGSCRSWACASGIKPWARHSAAGSCERSSSCTARPASSRRRAKASLRGCPKSSPSTATTRWPSRSPRARLTWLPRPGLKTAKSWGCATRSWPSRACSSIPNRSSPSMATPCSRTSWSTANEPPRSRSFSAPRGGACHPRGGSSGGMMIATVVDLRSDTVTQPTPGMRAAMMAAPLGDDVFGDDPSVNALQEKIAGMLGFEAALFVPTGTQSNLCAILSHCQRGEEYIVGQMQHCYRWEGGGGAVFGSVQPQPLEHQSDGSLALADIEAAIKPDDPHFARTRLLALENTLGGKLLPFAYIEQATELA